LIREVFPGTRSAISLVIGNQSKKEEVIPMKHATTQFVIAVTMAALFIGYLIGG
jgi:hypothetical protein